MAHITLSIDGAVASLFLDNPPQNRIGNEMIDRLSVAIDSQPPFLGIPSSHSASSHCSAEFTVSPNAPAARSRLIGRSHPSRYSPRSWNGTAWSIA
jgi:hypothetical protein